jgi:exodeoxyribonuclease V alpha subunit
LASHNLHQQPPDRPRPPLVLQAWRRICAGRTRIERKTGLSLAESPISAIRLALLSKVLVITGGPGVGKTTIVNAILRILAGKGVNLLLCAPIGRAAKRMTGDR